MSVTLYDSRGNEFMVDVADFDRVFNSGNWSTRKDGYLHAIRGGKCWLLHRWILRPERSQYVDHVNGDRRDNRRDNLRLCTKAENCRNQVGRRDGLKGASWNKAKRKWIAQITFNYKRIHIGNFDTEEAAHAAYCERARQLHGDFAHY